jgi:hypothetical protein
VYRPTSGWRGTHTLAESRNSLPARVARNCKRERGNPPLNVANRRTFFPDDLDRGVGHARQSFKPSREGDLIHPFKDEAAHRKRPRRQPRLRSLTHKQRTAPKALSLRDVSGKHALRAQFLRGDTSVLYAASVVRLAWAVRIGAAGTTTSTSPVATS